jgi:hypothetical protein
MRRGPVELRREVRSDDIQGASDFAEQPPIEGDEAFINNTDYMTFGTAKEPAAT